MKLPALDQPARYGGLYVYDFGEWTSVGYTAQEIAVLLESPEYQGGKVYRIWRAWPDGRMELQGVSAARFQAESAMLFHRAERELAERDFAELVAAAEGHAPPSRAAVQLAELSWAAAEQESNAGRFVTAVLFPAEYEHEMGSWLAAISYRGGDLAEGGVSHAANFNSVDKVVLQRAQLWSATSGASRSAEEVLATVRRAVQR